MGLMQLMPRTAGFMAGKRFRGHRRHALFNPEYNIELGQSYVQHLLAFPGIEGNLFYTTVAYNGGPGNLRKWLAKVDHQDDPFLLIESIPARETRHYIKSVISNLAIYRAQLGEPALSLRELAAGGTGRFVSLSVPQLVGSDSGS